ncbi:MAG: WD40 repeat domain-containing protein [Pirellulaceae bacterium]
MFGLLQSCEQIREMRGHKKFIQGLRFSPSGAVLASVDSEPKGLRLWVPETGGLAYQLDAYGVAVEFTPDGAQVAVAPGYCHKSETDVQLWDVETGKLARTVRGAIKAESLAFSADGRHLAICSSLPGLAELWDLESETCVQRLDPGYTSLDDLAFVDDDRSIALVG